jgi:hypothetical protein
MTAKRLRAKWPKHLVIPSEKQFQHGKWIRHECEIDAPERCQELHDAAIDADYGSDIDEHDVEDLRYSCNTQCCLVGWTALAMGESACTPDSLRNPATADFLNKFMEFAGYEPTDPKNYRGDKLRFIERTAERASDVFEGDGTGRPEDFEMYPKEDGIPLNKPLTPRRARNLWKKTAEFFGYDTKNLVD